SASRRRERRGAGPAPAATRAPTASPRPGCAAASSRRPGPGAVVRHRARSLRVRVPGASCAGATRVVSSGAMRWLLPLVLLIGVALRVQHLDYGLDTHDLSRSILSHQQDEEGMVRAVLSGAGAGRYPWQSPSAGLLRGDPQPGIYMLWGSLGY